MIKGAKECPSTERSKLRTWKEHEPKASIEIFFELTIARLRKVSYKRISQIRWTLFNLNRRKWVVIILSFSHEKRFCLFLSFALFVGIGMWVPNMVLHAMIISCSCNLECCDEENIIRLVSKIQTLSVWLKLLNNATIWLKTK